MLFQYIKQGAEGSKVKIAKGVFPLKMHQTFPRNIQRSSDNTWPPFTGMIISMQKMKKLTDTRHTTVKTVYPMGPPFWWVFREVFGVRSKIRALEVPILALENGHFCQKCPFSSIKKWHLERLNLKTKTTF